MPPYPGNRLTPREYQARWMARYAQILGTPRAVGRQRRRVDAGRHHPHVPHGRRRPRLAGQPQYALTQALRLIADTADRAVLPAGDPCDPSRVPPVVALAASPVDVSAAGPR